MAVKYSLPDGMQREGLRVEETAALLGCGRTMIYALLRSGRLRAVKLGTRTIIPRSEIQRFLASRHNDAPDAA